MAILSLERVYERQRLAACQLQGNDGRQSEDDSLSGDRDYVSFRGFPTLLAPNASPRSGMRSVLTGSLFFPFLFFVLSIERKTVSCTDGREPETD
jgi:hypothetical protein